jgi:HD-GYP domain-containing protein (c-di-GMP phosphodiesterase class II)
MRKVLVSQLRTGDRLGRDVYSTPDVPPLLRAGVRVSESYRFSLERAGVAAVWIDDGLSEGIEPLEVLDVETKSRATTAIRDAFRDVTRTLPNGGKLSGDSVGEMTEVADLIVRDVTRNVHSALALNDLANADGYTLKHSLAVTTLGLALGLRVMRKHGWIDVDGKRRFDCGGGRMSALGVGLLLHDIGKLAVPPEILRKTTALNDDEWKTMREHPTLGVEILKRDGISALSRAVVRSHHERWNGSGYPDSRVGDDTHQFARIAAVADVFDALTSDRYYRKAMALPDACDFIERRVGVDFDPEVVDVFKSFVAPYPPGTRVVLSDGYCGLVKQVRPDAVRFPIVRIIMDPSGALVPAREIDLSRTPGLTVVSTQFEIPETAPV